MNFIGNNFMEKKSFVEAFRTLFIPYVSEILFIKNVYKKCYFRLKFYLHKILTENFVVTSNKNITTPRNNPKTNT